MGEGEQFRTHLDDGIIRYNKGDEETEEKRRIVYYTAKCCQEKRKYARVIEVVDNEYMNNKMVVMENLGEETSTVG